MKTFRKKYGHFKYLLFILPSLIGFYTFAIHPNLAVYPLAFHKWNGLSPNKTYVGWQNFKVITNDPNFWRGVSNTVLYILFLIGIQTVLALLLAVILRKGTRHNYFFRTFFFLPMVLSSVTVGLTWSYMYDPNIGILNELFVWLGFDGMKGFNWVGLDRIRSIASIVFIHIWHNLGYPITILTASIVGIPETLYEAAAVEGANPFQVFFRVTLPLILPGISTILLLTTITGAQAFDYVFLMSGSGTGAIYDTFAVGIYRSLMNSTNLGMPAAQGIMLGITVAIVVLFQFRFSRRVEKTFE